VHWNFIYCRIYGHNTPRVLDDAEEDASVRQFFRRDMSSFPLHKPRMIMAAMMMVMIPIMIYF